MAKRKPSYEQALALERGQAVARRNARARRHARETEVVAPQVEHEHRFGDWSSRFEMNGYEKRYCDCGAFEARPVRL